MAKSRYKPPNDDDDDEVPDGKVQNIDPNERVDCMLILQLGLPIMLNEVRRLRQLSEKKGLSGRGAGQITRYLETASGILKAHKNLNINPLTQEDLDKIPPEALAELVIKAAQQLEFDGTDLNVVRKLRGAKPPNET